MFHPSVSDGHDDGPQMHILKNRSNKANNQINVIYPYLHNGTWVFDDPDVELVKEALIAGVPEIIQSFIGDAKSFTAIISKDPFSGYSGLLKLSTEDYGGGTYTLEGTDMQGWLCPAILNYFLTIPKTIYFKIQL